jgi:hypothetical protein
VPPITFRGDQELSRVSLGNGELLSYGKQGGMGLQHHTLSDGDLWVEGAPRNVAPRKSLNFKNWLSRVDGAFRGLFYSSTNKSITLFTDPYGARTLFWTRTAHGAVASDKVASLVPYLTQDNAMDWGAVLEAMFMGCILSTETTLRGVEQLDAGTLLTIEGGGNVALFRYREKYWESINPRRRSLFSEAQRLSKAIANSVESLWGENADATMLLSGGYDSRWVSTHAPDGWQALTIASGGSKERDMACQVAERLGAKHSVQEIDSERWNRIINDGHLLTAAMYDPIKGNLLEPALRWQDMGIEKVIHGWLFDTLMKGYFAYPAVDFVSDIPEITNNIAYLGAAVIFDAAYLHQARHVLSDSGRDLLRTRMATFEQRLSSHVTKDGFEFGFENLQLSYISRIMDMPMGFAFLEGAQVLAPIYCEDIWRWWSECRPEFRKPALAYLLGFSMHTGLLAWMPKGESGEVAPKQFMRSLARQILPEKVIRSLHQKVNTFGGSQRRQQKRQAQTTWGFEEAAQVLLTPPARACVIERLSHLAANDLFSCSALEDLVLQLEGKPRVDHHLFYVLNSLSAWDQFISA